MFVADQRKTAPAPGRLRQRLRHYFWRRCLLGLAAVAFMLLLAAAFAAYQMPELLLDWTNLRYCG